jgi:hypothetical protein
VQATSKTATNAVIYGRSGPSTGISILLNAQFSAATSLAGTGIAAGYNITSLSPPSSFVDGTTHLLGARRAGQTVEIRVDGKLSNSISDPKVATFDVSEPGTPSVIGQNGGLNGQVPGSEFEQLHGEVAELIGTSGTLAATDLSNIESYLMARYGL